MALFGFKKRDKKIEFQISENDRIWVEETFNWLVGAFGLPNKNSQLITFTEKYFHNSLSESELKISNIIKDLSKILNLDTTKISYEIIKDIRDSHEVPYEIEGFPFESETEKIGNTYKILIANSLPPNRLLSRLIYELITIKLYESELRFETGDGNTVLTVYFASVYLGFGIILSQNLLDMGVSNDGFWETKWSYSSEIPEEMLAYFFGIYLKVFERDILPFKDEIPKGFYNLLEKAEKYVELFSGDLLSKSELEANDLYFQSEKLIKNHEYESAFRKLNEIISISKNDNSVSFISYVFERLGYIKLREEKFEESIEYFEKALKIDHDNFIARDNIAYALLRMGDIKQGKKHIDKSISLTNKDIASIYRNLALYYWAKGYIEEAEDNFILSFESTIVPVFLRELDYSKFLLANGEKEKSDKYLLLSIEKREPEALKITSIFKQ